MNGLLLFTRNRIYNYLSKKAPIVRDEMNCEVKMYLKRNDRIENDQNSQSAIV